MTERMSTAMTKIWVGGWVGWGGGVEGGGGGQGNGGCTVMHADLISCSKPAHTCPQPPLAPLAPLAPVGPWRAAACMSSTLSPAAARTHRRALAAAAAAAAAAAPTSANRTLRLESILAVVGLKYSCIRNLSRLLTCAQ